MNNKTSVYHALKLILIISPEGGVSVSELNVIFSCSTPTTKRLITVARRLGASIKSIKTDNSYRYSLENAKVILSTVQKLLESYKIVQHFESVATEKKNALFASNLDNIKI